MNPIKTFAVVSTLLLLLSACGPAVVDSTEERSLDGVKLITSSITEPQDPASFEQTKYTIDANNRLLLRYEMLADSAAEVRTQDGHKIWLLLSPLSVSSATPAATPAIIAAAASLKVCPLKRNWMMAATWTRAHPYSPQGRWSTNGGDFEPSECVTATTTNSGFAAYDVTPWFVNYIRGRKQNYGLILVFEPAAASSSNQSAEISGDLSGSYSPRLRWEKSVQTPGIITPSPTPAN